MLKKRLVNFSRKLNLATAHDFYEHWRDSNYDHLSCAPWYSTAGGSAGGAAGCGCCGKHPGW